MGIGEPVRYTPPQVSNQNSNRDTRGKAYLPEFHYGALKRFFIVFFLFMGVFPLVLFSPIIVFYMVLDWRAGLAILVIFGIAMIPLAIGFGIAIPISLYMIQSTDKDNYTLLAHNSLLIYHKPTRRMQSRDLNIPYQLIKSVEIDPDKVERSIRSRPKNPMQFLFSTPAPPVGGFYTTLAGKENLVSILLKERIRIHQVKPGFHWVLKPDEHWVDEVFINIAEDQKYEFKKDLEKRIGGGRW